MEAGNKITVTTGRREAPIPIRRQSKARSGSRPAQFSHQMYGPPTVGPPQVPWCNQPGNFYRCPDPSYGFSFPQYVVPGPNQCQPMSYNQSYCDPTVSQSSMPGSYNQVPVPYNGPPGPYSGTPGPYGTLPGPHYGQPAMHYGHSFNGVPGLHNGPPGVQHGPPGPQYGPPGPQYGPPRPQCGIPQPTYRPRGQRCGPQNFLSGSLQNPSKNLRLPTESSNKQQYSRLPPGSTSPTPQAELKREGIEKTKYEKVYPVPDPGNTFPPTESRSTLPTKPSLKKVDVFRTHAQLCKNINSSTSEDKPLKTDHKTGSLSKTSQRRLLKKIKEWKKEGKTSFQISQGIAKEQAKQVDVEEAEVAEPFSSKQEVYCSELSSEEVNDWKYFCDPCELGFAESEQLESHCCAHLTCENIFCYFIGEKFALNEHMTNQHATGYISKILRLTSPEEIQEWTEERKRNFPTLEKITKNLAEKLRYYFINEPSSNVPKITKKSCGAEERIKNDTTCKTLSVSDEKKKEMEVEINKRFQLRTVFIKSQTYKAKQKYIQQCRLVASLTKNATSDFSVSRTKMQKKSPLTHRALPAASGNMLGDKNDQIAMTGSKIDDLEVNMSSETKKIASNRRKNLPVRDLRYKIAKNASHKHALKKQREPKRFTSPLRISSGRHGLSPLHHSRSLISRSHSRSLSRSEFSSPVGSRSSSPSSPTRYQGSLRSYSSSHYRSTPRHSRSPLRHHSPLRLHSLPRNCSPLRHTSRRHSPLRHRSPLRLRSPPQSHYMSRHHSPSPHHSPPQSHYMSRHHSPSPHHSPPQSHYMSRHHSPSPHHSPPQSHYTSRHRSPSPHGSRSWFHRMGSSHRGHRASHKIHNSPKDGHSSLRHHSSLLGHLSTVSSKSSASKHSRRESPSGHTAVKIDKQSFSVSHYADRNVGSLPSTSYDLVGGRWTGLAQTKPQDNSKHSDHSNQDWNASSSCTFAYQGSSDQQETAVLSEVDSTSSSNWSTQDNSTQQTHNEERNNSGSGLTDLMDVIDNQSEELTKSKVPILDVLSRVVALQLLKQNSTGDKEAQALKEHVFHELVKEEFGDVVAEKLNRAASKSSASSIPTDDALYSSGGREIYYTERNVSHSDNFPDTIRRAKRASLLNKLDNRQKIWVAQQLVSIHTITGVSEVNDDLLAQLVRQVTASDFKGTDSAQVPHSELAVSSGVRQEQWLHHHDSLTAASEEKWLRRRDLSPRKEFIAESIPSTSISLSENINFNIKKLHKYPVEKSVSHAGAQLDDLAQKTEVSHNALSYLRYYGADD